MLMDALVIDEFGGLDKLHFEQLSIPEPSPNEILIKIAYTSINPVDWKIREGMLKNLLPHKFPIILGWDVSGTVAKAGAKVTNFKFGDEILACCRKSIIHNGAYAEYITFDAAATAHKTRSLTFAQAAAIPLVSLTAWQALYDHAKLQSGETVLITAGAGGVGSLAIQLANYTGASVYTTASKENHSYVKNLGAKNVIDYKQENVNQQLHDLEPSGFDVILDCVGGETLNSCYSLMKPGGRLVTIAGHVDKVKADEAEINASFCFVEPNGIQLTKIVDLIDKGKIKVPYIKEMSLAQAAEAQQQSREGHTRGKIVLRIK
jgi:NADPH2:quinone reductase